MAAIVNDAATAVQHRVDVADVEVVAPNFKRRLSGVTTTVVQLVPLQARRLKIATLGPGLPAGMPWLSWRQVLGLLKRPRGRPFRIWHARRNVEMIGGVLLRDVLRAPLRLLFTSAAQRDHKRLTKWLIRRMDAVIATNPISAGYLEVPHTVILHGVNLEEFHPRRVPEDDYAAAGLPGKRAIGCFGRIRSQKGTDLFVDAMIALLPEYPDWTAVITGRVTVEHQAFARDLHRRIAEAGLADRILFLGEVPDIRLWYRRVSLYVAPSRNEGFGLTPLEAMASGSAVVASDAGAYRYLIDEGKTGFVVPAGDGKALESAIRRYLADPDLLAAHSANALADVHARFPLDGEARAIEQVYERLWAEA
jgi:mannosyltransferase